MRIILRDIWTGHIWGDSADLNGERFQQDEASFAANEHYALAFARALDQSNREYDREYRFVTAIEPGDVTGYEVYRADINGSDAVDNIRDGQDGEIIRAVRESCQFIGFIKWKEWAP